MLELAPPDRMGLHDPLRPTRGSRRIGDVERRLRVNRRGSARRARRRQPSRKRLAAGAVVQADASRPRGRPLCAGGVDEEQRRTAVLEHPPRRLSRPADSQRTQHETGLQRAQHDRGVDGRIGGAKPDPLAREQSVTLKGAGRSLCEGVKRAEIKDHVLADDGERVRSRGGAARNAVRYQTESRLFS